MHGPTVWPTHCPDSSSMCLFIFSGCFVGFAFTAEFQNMSMSEVQIIRASVLARRLIPYLAAIYWQWAARRCSWIWPENHQKKKRSISFLTMSSPMVVTRLAKVKSSQELQCLIIVTGSYLQVFFVKIHLSKTLSFQCISKSLIFVWFIWVARLKSRHFPEPWTPTKATLQDTNQNGMQNMQENHLPHLVVYHMQHTMMLWY